MFQPKNLDKMNYQELYKLQSQIVHELSTYDQQENWTHYGTTADTFTHAHLKRKKDCKLCNKKFYKTISLMKHMKAHHNVAMKKKFKLWNKPQGLKNEYLLACVMCEHPFSNIKEITEHNCRWYIIKFVTHKFYPTVIL